MKLKDIPLDQIRVTENVRLDPEHDLGGLMESIEKYDILQPVLVIQRNGHYELVAGHRRLAAMKARNQPTIPAIVRDDITLWDIPYLKLVENVQRKDMSSREIVAALDAIKATRPGISAAGLGKLLGKSDAWVYDQYLAVKTYDELLASGMTEAELKVFTKNELLDLGRVKDRRERIEAAREAKAEGPAAIRARRSVTKRGGFVDRSGGIAIMGGGASLSVRVLCETQDAMRDVLSCLLRLKTRRVTQAQKPRTA
jgi:ParB/RepB/Spo0J family partition protein